MIGMALGILSAGAKFAQGQAAASAANEQSLRAYDQQLKIREQTWKNSQAVYGNKLIQYKQNMQHADRAASRAYGAEQTLCLNPVKSITPDKKTSQKSKEGINVKRNR